MGCPSYDPKITFGHGQSVTGIIAASHNNIGIRGIAPQVNIAPVNIFNDWLKIVDPWQLFDSTVIYAEDAFDYASAIDWAWDDSDADVLSNSWTYRRHDTIDVLHADVIIAAIGRARTQGRNGLGSVVVFSSGNFNNKWPGVAFPATVDGVVTVGAIDKNGDICSYSSRGPEMDLVAPSGAYTYPDVYTIDREGSKGYVDTSDIFYHFSGTSAACPQVSGVAALMLSINPALTEAQVRSALQQTATDMGTAGFDTIFGYGRVDAEAALEKVYLYITGSTLVCTSDSTFTLHNLPSGTTVNWTPGPYLSYVSGQGTDNYTVKASSSSVWGSSWVKATITTDCDTVEIQKNIYVGCTEIGDLLFTNDLGEEDFLCSDREGNLVEFSSSTCCNYFDIWLLNEYGTQVLDKSKTYTTQGSLDFSWISPGYYLVQVRGVNDCGTGEWNG